MIAFAALCLVGGFVAGWLISDHRSRLAHQESNARIINAWIRRPDVPPITAYRSTQQSSNTSGTKSDE